MGGSSDLEDEMAHAAASAQGNTSKQAAKERCREIKVVHQNAISSKKKMAKEQMNAEVILTTHLVSEIVPWNQITHNPAELLAACQFCTTS